MSNRSFRRFAVSTPKALGMACLLSVCSFAPTAAAQGSREAEAAAEVLFNEGKRLIAAGRFADACPKFEESQRLDPAIGTLLYLGECYDRVGRTASAWAAFSAAVSQSRKSNEKSRESIALERQKMIESRLSKVTILVPAESRLPGLVVKRDGVIIGEPSFGTATPVDPGKHVVEATAPGKAAWRTELDVPATGTELPVTIPVLEEESTAVAAATPSTGPTGPAPVAPEPVPANSDAEPSESPTLPSAAASARPLAPTGADPLADESSGSAQAAAGYAIGATGIAGIVVGAILGGLASSTESDSEAFCDPNDPALCDQEGLDLLDEAQGYATGATVSLIAGGVLVAGGLVLVLTAPSGSDESAGETTALRVRFAPVVGPGLGAARISVRW